MYTSARKVTLLLCVMLSHLAMQDAFSATRTITGWVVDELNKPVTQGEVACFPPAGDVKGFCPDDPLARNKLLAFMHIKPPAIFASLRRDGGFSFTTDTAQDYIIYARAGGFAPASRYVSQEAPTLPLKFTLAPGRNLQGTLLDETGKAVVGAEIHLGFSIRDHFSMPPGNMLGARFAPEEDSGYYLLPSAHSDKHGHFLFTHLPDYRFYLTVKAAGFHSIEDFAAVPSATPQLIILHHLGKITGKVIRQRDGKPVRQFLLTIRSAEHFDMEGMHQSHDGSFCVYENDNDQPSGPATLSIEAQGCMVTRVENIFFAPDAIPLTIRLPVAGKLTGQVNDKQSRQPLVGVEISTEDSPVGDMWDLRGRPEIPAAKAVTDKHGRFALEARMILLPVLTVHKAGYGRMVINGVNIATPLQLILEKGATIIGKVDIALVPALTFPLAIPATTSINSRAQDRSPWYDFPIRVYSAMTHNEVFDGHPNADGSFSVTDLASGSYLVAEGDAPEITVGVQVSAGQTVDINHHN